MSAVSDQKTGNRPEPGLQAALRDGAAAAWPICFGYFPVGMAFGILAQKAGLGVLESALMSILVFAGSAQLIAVGMIGAGASAGAIIFMTFMVNLRHFLMSSALSLHLSRTGRWFVSLFAYGVTDESFAVNMARFRTGDWDPGRALAVNHLANGAWVAATVAGALVGAFIPEGAFGIDYALIGMFICLLVFQLNGAVYVLTALVSAGLAVVLALVWAGEGAVVVSSVIAAGAGYLVKLRSRKTGGEQT